MFKDLIVFRNRSLFSLFGARFVSLLGNAIAPVALSFAVLDIPGASATTLGLVLMARMVAQVLFYLVGGAIADRLPRVKVMVSADLVAALAQSGVAALVITKTGGASAIAALVVIGGAATAAFEPASRSVMPQLVSGQELQAANGFHQLSMRGGSILGAALGGILVGTIGPGAALGVDAGSFFVSAALILLIRVEKIAPETPGTTLFRQLLDGWTEFTARKWVWVIICQLSFVNTLLAGSFFVLGPLVAKQSLGGAPAWGAVLTAQAIGFVAGSAAAIRFRPKYPIRVSCLLILGFPLPLFLLADRAPIALIATVALIAGACIDMYEVLFDTALQKRVPAEALGRVMSYEAVGSLAFVPLGAAIVGPASAAVGVGPCLVGAGVLIVLAAPVGLLTRSVREISDVREAGDVDAASAVTPGGAESPTP